MFKWLKNFGGNKKIVRAIFDQLNQKARNPDLFGPNMVPDNPDGRFEVMMLLATALFVRLANVPKLANQQALNPEIEAARDQVKDTASNPAVAELAQDVFDFMFKTFDGAMRELGVSDTKVGRHIRVLAESAYGRMHAYFEPLKSGDKNQLAEKIARNIFGSSSISVGKDDVIAQYAIEWVGQLAAVSDEEILSGHLSGQ